MTDLEKAKNALADGYACAICGEANIYTSRERGVKPLLHFLDENVDLMGYSAADKVVGSAAAMVYCLLDVRRVYGRIMTVSAVKILRSQGIETAWDGLTQNILNRTKTDLCPIEKALLGIEDPEDGLPIIRSTLSKLENQSKARG